MLTGCSNDVTPIQSDIVLDHSEITQHDTTNHILTPNVDAELDALTDTIVTDRLDDVAPLQQKQTRLCRPAHYCTYQIVAH